MFSFVKPRSPVNVFFIGGGKAGSWKIRGEQIASTRRNWVCGETITASSLKNHDVFVAVKQLRPQDAEQVKRAGKILVYDIIDAWAQPEDSLRIANAEEARAFFAARWEGLPIDSCIFPDAQMQADLASLVPHSTVLYHHYYPRLKARKPRTHIRTIGYQGRKKYLGEWGDAIKDIAGHMGLEFVINPSSLMDLDIGFIARGGDYNGYMERAYKSNVKLANLMACGIPPLILTEGMAYHETWDRQESYFDSRETLASRLDALVNNAALRLSLREALLEKARDFQLPTIAGQYEKYFLSLVRQS
ncbi:MAG TPA: glycosyltransferase [Pseudomonadales bacterium]|nr:glycosyltransferase [Pseudomonadales bacterium]